MRAKLPEDPRLAVASYCLDAIEEAIRECDRRALTAATRSKWSIQDYHMCLLYHYRRLWYRVNRAANLGRSLPRTPYAKQLDAFRLLCGRMNKHYPQDHRGRITSGKNLRRPPQYDVFRFPPLPQLPPLLPPPPDWVRPGTYPKGYTRKYRPKTKLRQKNEPQHHTTTPTNQQGMI